MPQNVSSRDSRHSNTSELAQEKLNNRFKNPVALKLGLATGTMLGGAILALLINAFMESRTLRLVKIKRPRIDYHQIDKDNIFGQFRNRRTGWCIDNLNQPSTYYSYNGPLATGDCHKFFAPSQYFHFNYLGELRQKWYCAEARWHNGVILGVPIAEMAPCHRKFNNQFWIRLKNTQFYYFVANRCLSAYKTTKGEHLRLYNCVNNSLYQRWDFLPVDKHSAMYNQEYYSQNITYHIYN